MRVLGTCALALSSCIAGELRPNFRGPMPPNRILILSASNGEILAGSEPTSNNAWDPIVPAPTPPPPAGPVTFQRLTHRPPKAARKAWERTCKELNADHLDRAAEYARETVRIDPEFGDAIELLAVFAMTEGNPAEAEALALRAIQVDPASARAHWFCALAQLRRGRPIPETRRHLEAAARVYPKAQEVLKRLPPGL
jgi:tetratricopeptide (TPR) repeat protein